MSLVDGILWMQHLLSENELPEDTQDYFKVFHTYLRFVIMTFKKNSKSWCVYPLTSITPQFSPQIEVSFWYISLIYFSLLFV